PTDCARVKFPRATLLRRCVRLQFGGTGKGGIQADPSRWLKIDRIAHPQASEVKRFFLFFHFFQTANDPLVSMKKCVWRIHHVRGGGPEIAGIQDAGSEYSPRTWGWTVAALRAWRMKSVFPTCVGGEPLFHPASPPPDGLAQLSSPHARARTREAPVF